MEKFLTLMSLCSKYLAVDERKKAQAFQAKDEQVRLIYS